MGCMLGPFMLYSPLGLDTSLIIKDYLLPFEACSIRFSKKIIFSLAKELQHSYKKYSRNKNITLKKQLEKIEEVLSLFKNDTGAMFE